MYEIRCDPAKGVMYATLSGMLTVDEVRDYIADLQRTFIEYRLRSYSMVIDVSQCPIQHQDVIQAMGFHMAKMPKANALAVITGSSLAKMQIRRLFTQPYVRIVDTLNVARSWVVDGNDPLLS